MPSNKNIFSQLFLVSLGLFFIHTVSCSQQSENTLTYYVSKTGSDNRKGTSEDEALGSVQEAVNRMNSGDQCYIMEGVYREEVRVVRKQNLTFHAYRDQRPVITGLDLLPPLEKVQSNVFQTVFQPDEKEPDRIWHLSGRGKLFTQVFLEDNLLPVSQFPNVHTPLNWEKHGSEIEIFPDLTASFISGVKPFPANHFEGGIFHAIVERKWNAVQGEIGSHEAGTLKMKEATQGWSRGLTGVYNKNLFSTEDGKTSGIGMGFIMHHYNAMDENGEWYWEKRSGKLYIYNIKNIEGKTPEARSRKFGLIIRHSQNISFCGIDFKAAGIQIYNSDQCGVDGSSITYSTPSYFHHDEFNGKSMVVISEGNQNYIRNSYIAHNWGSGVDILKGNKNELVNCLVEDVDWMGTYNACVRVSGNQTLIRNNTLRKSGRFNIYGIGVKNGKILNNHMSDALLIGQDGGAFYTHLEDGQQTVIAFNRIDGVLGIPWERSPHTNHNISVGIYLDGGCKNFNLHDNKIEHVEYGIMYNASPHKNNGYSSGNRIENNTISVRGKASIVSKNLPDYYRDNVVRNNTVNRKIGALAEKDGNNLSPVAVEGQLGNKEDDSGVNLSSFPPHLKTKL